MKIIKAKDYGYRVVAVVVLNPDDPDSVHADGSPHTDAPPAGTPADARPFEWCTTCFYNWQEQEFTWDGDALFKEDGTRKNEGDLLAEISVKLNNPDPRETPPEPQTLLGIEGMTI